MYQTLYINRTLMKKLQLCLNSIKLFWGDSLGLIKNLWIVNFWSIERPGVFSGFYSFWFATYYAKKRTRLYKKEWDQMGRKQAVMPFGEDKLIVCSKMELRSFQKRKLIVDKHQPKKLIKKSYFTT